MLSVSACLLLRKNLATVYNCYTLCAWQTVGIYAILSGKDIFLRTLLVIFKQEKHKTVLSWNKVSLLASSLNVWLYCTLKRTQYIIKLFCIRPNSAKLKGNFGSMLNLNRCSADNGSIFFVLGKNVSHN